MAFKRKLTELDSEKNTCNQLKELVSQISHYAYVNDLDKDSIDPVIIRFDDSVGWIKDYIKYGVLNRVVKINFRKTQDECFLILNHTISRIEAKSKNP